MKTTKPLSTISYNSQSFLHGVLERLIANEIISFYAYIPHQPEEDEEKEHFHVYMTPAKQVDDLWLRKLFNEADPAKPDKPKKCLPLTKSKFADWYWYGLHNKAYLASKRQTRKYHYDPMEMLTSDPEMLAELVRQNPVPKSDIIQAIELRQQGYDDISIAVMLNVPMARVKFFVDAMHLIDSQLGFTYRENRANHEPKDETPLLEGDTTNEND